MTAGRGNRADGCPGEQSWSERIPSQMDIEHRALLEGVARTSAAVAGTSARLAKIHQLADFLRGLRPEEVRVAVHYLSGELPQGTVGVGWAALRDLPPSAATASIELLEVDAILSRIK